jgi:uncharacterized protein
MPAFKRRTAAFFLSLIVFVILAPRAFANPNSDLINAVKKGDAARVHSLLHAGASADAKNKNNVTALIYAAYYGRASIAKALIAAGADVNAKDNDSATALMNAAYYGHAAIVEMLLAAGAQTGPVNALGHDAEQLAEGGHHPRIARMIREAAAASHTVRHATVTNN